MFKKRREMASSHWGLGDRLEQVKIRNKRSKEKPTVPKAVRTKLKINKVGVAHLIGFEMSHNCGG